MSKEKIRYFADGIKKHMKDEYPFAVIPLLVFEDSIGPIMLYPTVKELLEEADIIFPEEELTKHLITGKLYEYGMCNMAENFQAACYLVKVGINKEELFTTDDDFDYEHTACLVFPADMILEWTRTEPKGEQ